MMDPTKVTAAPTKIVQTAGRDAMSEFAPKFAELNDDVLFGEVWSRTDKLSLRDRSLITVTALVASGITDSSLKYHIGEAKKNGVTREEIAEALTHVAFMRGGRKHGPRSAWRKRYTSRNKAEDQETRADRMPVSFFAGAERRREEMKVLTVYFQRAAIRRKSPGSFRRRPAAISRRSA